MNIHIELDDPTNCDGCPLLDTPPLEQGKPTTPPACNMIQTTVEEGNSHRRNYTDSGLCCDEDTGLH